MILYFLLIIHSSWCIYLNVSGAQNELSDNSYVKKRDNIILYSEDRTIILKLSWKKIPWKWNNFTINESLKATIIKYL